MIKEFSVDFDIKECCEALRVSRSGVLSMGPGGAESAGEGECPTGRADQGGL